MCIAIQKRMYTCDDKCLRHTNKTKKLTKLTKFHFLSATTFTTQNGTNHKTSVLCVSGLGQWACQL